MSENQGRYVRRFCHLEHLTHQLFEIVCLVIWKAEVEIVSPVHTTCFQHCAAVHTRHHSIPLKAMFVESFHHVRRKHLTRVTSSLETLGQPSDLPFLAKVLWWYHVDHLAHFPLEERYRNVKHCNDHRRVFSLGLVARCPIQNQSHELNKGGVAANVSDLDSLVFTSVAHNRHRIAELFGSFRVSTNFGQIFLPGVDCISASSTSILASNSSSSPTSLVRPFRTSSESSFSLVLPSRWDPRSPQPQFDPCSPSCVWVSVVHGSVTSICHTSSSGTRVATTSIPSITYKPPIVTSSLLGDAGVERTAVPDPYAVGTIIGGDAGFAFTIGLPEISLVGVSLGRAPLRSLRSCGPNAIDGSICSF